MDTCGLQVARTSKEFPTRKLRQWDAYFSWSKFLSCVYDHTTWSLRGGTSQAHGLIFSYQLIGLTFT